MSPRPEIEPPPFVALHRPQLRPIIRGEILAPPDPLVLPWEPMPGYDVEAIKQRQRLERAAAEKRARMAEEAEAARRAEIARRVLPSQAEPIDTKGGVDLATAGDFFARASLGAAPAPKASEDPGSPPEPSDRKSEVARKPAFGEPQGGRGASRKKAEEVKPKPRHRPPDEVALDRLKIEWLPPKDR